MPESDAGSLQLELTLSRTLPTSVGSKEAFTDFVTGNLDQTSKGRLETKTKMYEKKLAFC